MKKILFGLTLDPKIVCRNLNKGEKGDLFHQRVVCKVDEVQGFTETITTGVWAEIAHFPLYCRIYRPQCFAITRVNPRLLF